MRALLPGNCGTMAINCEFHGQTVNFSVFLVVSQHTDRRAGDSKIVRVIRRLCRCCAGGHGKRKSSNASCLLPVWLLLFTVTTIGVSRYMG